MNNTLLKVGTLRFVRNKLSERHKHQHTAQWESF